MPPLLLAVLALALLDALSPLDLAIQDTIFALGDHAWPVGKAEGLPRTLFYDGPKQALIVLGIGLACLLAASWRWPRLAHLRRPLGFLLLVLGLVPALAGLGKQVTDVACPSQLIRYGGDRPYLGLLQPTPAAWSGARKARCFPAGHASGGYALIALGFVFPRRRLRLAGLAAGLLAGTLMGGYQMAVGAHFLSHTLATLILACLVCAGLRRLILPTGEGA